MFLSLQHPLRFLEGCSILDFSEPRWLRAAVEVRPDDAQAAALLLRSQARSCDFWTAAKCSEDTVALQSRQEETEASVTLLRAGRGAPGGAGGRVSPRRGCPPRSTR